MASNTPNPLQQYGNTTGELSTKVGAPRQIAVDTNKNTLVVMDGVTAGGHPLAKEAVKIKAGTPNVKINNGTEATLGADITITLVPGYIATSITMVTDPAGQPAGKYLAVNYTNEAGAPGVYYVDMASLVDIYTAGDGITIDANNKISVNLDNFGDTVLKTGGGLETGADGLISVKLEDIVDTSAESLLKIENGKITLKNLVSTDSGNILKAGSDKLVYMPADLGTL